MTDTVSSAPPHVEPARHRNRRAGARHPERPVDRQLGPREQRAVGDRRPRHRPPQPALVDLRRVPRLRRLAALVDRRRGASGRRLRPRHRRDLLAHLDPEPRGCHPPHPVLVPRAEVRRAQLDHHLGRRCCSSRSIALAVCVSNPETPFGVLLARGGARRIRRRQLRQLDVEHHLLLPAEGEGLGARPQRRRRQPRCSRRAVRRADRHHDRRRRRAEPARSPAGSGSRSSCSRCSAPARYMDNLSNAKADFAGSAAALKEPHLWIMSLLYIGTFGSFIGFASVFPKLIADQFPEFSAIARRRRVGRASPSSAPSSARSPAPTAAGSPTASAALASRWSPSRRWA